MAIKLDLSGLNSAETTTPDAAPTGEAMRIALADIDPDPNQPRKSITPEKLAELAASIKEQGVLQAISVRPNPDKPGRWLINSGERRWRASHDAGLADIPVVVNHVYSDYAQVVENIQREELKPMELALFIQSKKVGGVKNAEIARKLGVDRSVINHHQALIEAPAAIEDAYNSGKTTSPKTIYELRSLYEKHPEAVEAWLATTEEVTRSGVSALAKELKGDGKPLVGNGAAGSGSENVGHDQQNAKDGQGGSTAGGGEGDGSTPAKTNSAQSTGNGGDPDPNAKRTSWPPGKVGADPDLIKRPLLVVAVSGRPAVVLLNRKPSDIDRVRVRFEDNGADEEVAIADCSMQLLMEEPK